MKLNLHRTLSWTRTLAAQSPEDTAFLVMLNDLQGNILKGHGRKFTANIFLTFASDGTAVVKKFFKELGFEITTAIDQLKDAQIYKASGKNGGPFLTVLLTASGYRALGLNAFMPQDAAFNAGMVGRPLNDPPQTMWEPTFSRQIHAMLLLGADSKNDNDDEPRNVALAAMLKRIAKLGTAVQVNGVELGNALFNKEDHNGIEHFGYVDGRSQPLMLEEDISKEKTTKWDPSIPLSQVLVEDRGGALDVSCGSYFVFRKLEQNVQAFKNREIALAEANGKIGERAGASVVGRFENGTPVAVHQDEVVMGKEKNVLNDFNFDDDPKGLKCPYAGHIRKTNPREDGTKEHLMARRGIPFGKRTDEPNDGNLENKPTSGVGLLFMAYQSDLANQFEFTQNLWANNVDFDFKSPAQPVGIDPVIGQGEPSPQRYPKEYGISLGDPFDFSGFVKMKGGEYFFAPSISFFKKII